MSGYSFPNTYSNQRLTWYQPFQGHHNHNKGIISSVVERHGLLHFCDVQFDMCFHLEVFVVSVVDFVLDGLLEILHLLTTY